MSDADRTIFHDGRVASDAFCYKTEARARVGRPQTSSSPPVIFIAGRPNAALLFWFFGDFRCGALFMLYINIKIGKNSC